MNTVLVDCFGADCGPLPILTGALDTLEQLPELCMILVGDPAVLTPAIHARSLEQRARVLPATDYITNEESPAVIFRGRDGSSLALALERLKADDDCIGLLTAGNTGAILLGSITRLGLIGNLKMPALSCSLPCLNGHMTCLVDCGGNVNATAEDLVTYAKMGNAYAKIMYGLDAPRVALLSVGKEKGKGNAVVKEAYTLLEQTDLRFIGNVEGNDLLCHACDVMAAGGFEGNILLKSTEGAGKAAMQLADACLTPEKKEQLSGLFDLTLRGGATLLGTAKPVIKMHGAASAETVLACTRQLLCLHKADFSRRLAGELA